MKVYVVCVNGAPQSGKTTFEALCNARLDLSMTYSSITPIKDFAMWFGWDGRSKDEADRRMLSNLKATIDDWYREKGELPFTLKKTYDAIKQFVANNSAPLFFHDGEEDVMVAFVDVREPKDLDLFKEKFNATTVIVKRGENEDKDWGNPSDNEVNNYWYNAIIKNNYGLEELGVTADYFIKALLETDKYCVISGEEEFYEFCN